MNHKPFRAVLVAAALAIGLVGCGHAGTAAEPTAGVSGESTAQSGPGVDVPKIWATNPLPDCPDVAADNNFPDPQPGVEIPTKETVAAALKDVQSPASEEWVHTELGWVTQNLLSVRSSILSTSVVEQASVGRTETRGFNRYMKHVIVELQAGHNIPDASLDPLYPEVCAA